MRFPKTLLIPHLPKIVQFLSLFYFSRSCKKNKISIINTYEQGGGAAKIAKDLLTNSRFSKEIGFFVNKKSTNNQQVIELEQSSHSRFQLFLEELEKVGGWLDISKISPLKLLRNTHFRSSKIVHLHNLHGYYFSYSILPKVVRHKKTIWTLHDEQLLTGHCACTLNCEQWKKGCGNCPNLNTYPAVKVDNTQKLVEVKARILKKIKPTIICPSEWLAERFCKAFPFITDVQVIPNGINTDIFAPQDKKKIRKELNLPLDAFILLFAAELSTSNPFKGGALINSLMNDGLGENTYLITIGGETTKSSPFHIPFGYIAEESKMADLYAAADVMIYPTKADNLPLVILEAMSSGLPVISSNLGGISEIIKDQENSFLIDSYYDKIAFQKCITNFRESTDEFKAKMARNARATVENKFSLHKMIHAYDKLYESFFDEY
jgi:glycosyltransferase involved in cell wall biosynthesis